MLTMSYTYIRIFQTIAQTDKNQTKSSKRIQVFFCQPCNFDRDNIQLKEYVRDCVNDSGSSDIVSKMISLVTSKNNQLSDVQVQFWVSYSYLNLVTLLVTLWINVPT